jgi:uncharacterized phage-associated protein
MQSYNIPVKDVAEYFLSKVDTEAGDCISNLKIQKLVYYAQGFVLAFTNKKLFNENIVAWQHGPVVIELYDAYRKYGANCIKPEDSYSFASITSNEELIDILDDVYSVYGQFSAWKLREMTHEEGPWKDFELNEVISIKDILDFFKTQIA